MPVLNGFINESMRLIPAALTIGSRLTPSQGLTIDGIYIPGNIKLVAPKYSIYRRGSVFIEPNTFIPERWYSRPELVRDKSVFAPFGIGKHPLSLRSSISFSVFLLSIIIVGPVAGQNYFLICPNIYKRAQNLCWQKPSSNPDPPYTRPASSIVYSALRTW